MIVRPLSLGLLFSIWSAPVFAETITVAAVASDRQVMMGDVFSLEVRVVAQVDGAISVELPQVDGLEELGRSKSEGTSISWSNTGQQIIREYTLNIEYQAQKAGKLEIPPILARVGNLSARSAAVVVDVLTTEDTESAAAAKANEVAPPDASERQLFARYRVDRAEAYLGQQILLDLEIYADPSVNFSVEESGAPPELDGFWREILDQPRQLNRRRESLAGRVYDVYRVWRIALFPLEAGERVVAPATLTFGQGRSMFSAGRRLRRKSLPLKLTILPLPTQGRPADFSAANVGRYEISSSLDRTELPFGGTVTLKLAVSGQGNLRSVRMPAVDNLPGFRVFPPNTTDDVRLDVAGVQGAKRLEVLLMPTQGGRLELPAFELSTFDPELGAYRTLSTPTLRLSVTGGPTESPPPVATKTEVKPTPRLRPLHLRAELKPVDPAPWRRRELWGAMASPALLWSGIWLISGLIHRRKERPQNQEHGKSKAAYQRLSAAELALSSNDLKGAYTAFAEALMALGTLRTGVVLRGLTHDQICETLAKAGLEAPLVEALRKELVAADSVRFAGLTAEVPSAQRWRRIIDSVDTLRELP